MRASKALITEAKKVATETGHVILVGLPHFADKRQGCQLYDTGSKRKAWNKWRNELDLAAAVFPDGDVV